MRTIVGPALAAALTAAILSASPAAALLPVEQELAPTVEQERTAPRTPAR